MQFTPYFGLAYQLYQQTNLHKQYNELVNNDASVFRNASKGDIAYIKPSNEKDPDSKYPNVKLYHICQNIDRFVLEGIAAFIAKSVATIAIIILFPPGAVVGIAALSLLAEGALQACYSIYHMILPRWHVLIKTCDQFDKENPLMLQMIFDTGSRVAFGQKIPA